ncbi:FMN-dependent NADH-azoreductase [Brevibacillus ginsengisoli]|uniref:FMN-dependent NADH-azoreductase n=1 Tax=Brevibacillus ginsengisoli TaxID=363854 RepID=UPI003CEF8DDD
MSQILYITANPKSESTSFSMSVGREFINAYRGANPNDSITELDLYKANIPEIDEDVFSGWTKLQQGSSFENLSTNEKAKISRINELTDQFVQADQYVFTIPLWNLSIPPRLKAYIDTICIAGKTFKYTAEGPVGLLEGKKAVLIQAAGGVYSQGPGQNMDFSTRYLKTILGFMGIKDVETIWVEGMAAAPEQADSIKSKAISQAQEAAKRFGRATVNS